jgi:uncharacterized RDD family membrane protein YckC
MSARPAAASTVVRPVAPTVIIDEARLRREFVTPEGAALPLELAGASDRLVAFVLDALIIAALLVGLILLNAAMSRGATGALVILAIFLLTHFYFTVFELRWQGRTPGKRFADLRVIDRAGGRLTPSAIFVRNVTREVEVVLPLVVLLHPTVLVADAPPIVALAAFLWLVVLGFFPLFNRDRLRVGDLIAGTVVVHVPKQVLLPDLSEWRPRPAAPPRPEGGANVLGQGPAQGPEQGTATAPESSPYTFTAAQLSIYGIYELQVLEEVLRRDRPDRVAALKLVADKVARKIGWEGGAIDPAAFLAAFYSAQRARLEQRLLFGQRKERKSS